MPRRRFTFLTVSRSMYHQEKVYVPTWTQTDLSFLGVKNGLAMDPSVSSGQLLELATTTYSNITQVDAFKRNLKILFFLSRIV